MLGALKTLVGAGLLVEMVETPADTFAFRHALTRAAVYGGLLRRERAAPHGRVAELLLSRPDRDDRASWRGTCWRRGACPPGPSGAYGRRNKRNA